VTGEVWISLKQNIIDTAVNECGTCLHTCVRTMHHILSSSAAACKKMKQLDEMSAKVSTKLTQYVFVRYLD